LLIYYLLISNASPLYSIVKNVQKQLYLPLRPHWAFAHRRGCRVRSRRSVGWVCCVKLGAQITEKAESFIINFSWSNRSFKRYACKAGAIYKSGRRNHRNAVRYGYACKAGASVKSQTLNSGNTIRYGYAGKAGAASKSINPNAGNAARYGKWRTRLSGRICMQSCFTFAIQHPIIWGIRRISSVNIYRRKDGAVAKSPIPNAGNAGWYGYAGKANTWLKSVAPNAGNATWYGYAGKVGSSKSINLNSGNVVRYSVTVFIYLLICMLYYS